MVTFDSKINIIDEYGIKLTLSYSTDRNLN